MARRSSWAALVRAQEAEARRRQADAVRAERRAELDRIADEKDRKRRYIEQRLEEVEEQNAQLDATVASLTQILANGLDRPDWAINFDSLKKPMAMPPFDAKGADRPVPPPKIDDFLLEDERSVSRSYLVSATPSMVTVSAAGEGGVPG